MTLQKTLPTLKRVRVVAMFWLLATAFGTHTAIYAQESASADVPDEITVTEKKPIRQLRREMDTAEKSFFSMFNKINDNKDFDTKCKKTTTLGSRRKVQVCTPRFLRVYQASLTSGASGSNRWDTPSTTGSRVAAKQALMQKQIDRLLADNENLRKAFQEFADSKHAYEIGMQDQ